MNREDQPGRTFPQILLLAVLAFALSLAGGRTVWAAGTDAKEAAGEENAAETVEEPAAEIVTKDGYRFCYRNGKKQTGWQTVNGSVYYFRTKARGRAPKGAALVGLKKLDGFRYYFAENGKMKTGWQEIDGSTYYFHKKADGEAPRGSAVTGLKKLKGYRYYFAKNGKMQTGWQEINGSRYFFKKKDGSIPKGGALTGQWTIGKYQYYFRDSGKLRTGWFTVGEKKRLYYANSKGRLKCDTSYKGITFNDKCYAESGTARSLKLLTMSIISEITTDSMTQSEKLRAAWNYMTNRSRWTYALIYPANFNSDWAIKQAYSMLSGKRGNCYSFACGFAALAEEVGYTAYLVSGRIPGSRDHASDGYTRHCWVRIDGRYYDPELHWVGSHTGIYGYSSYPIRHQIRAIYPFAP